MSDTQKQPKRPGCWPIPDSAMKEFRKRKGERGINIGRSLNDALAFALRPEFKKLWY